MSCMKESVHWGGRPEEILLERDSPRSSVMPLEYVRMLLFVFPPRERTVACATNLFQGVVALLGPVIKAGECKC